MPQGILDDGLQQEHWNLTLDVHIVLCDFCPGNNALQPDFLEIHVGAKRLELLVQAVLDVRSVLPMVLPQLNELLEQLGCACKFSCAPKPTHRGECIEHEKGAQLQL